MLLGMLAEWQSRVPGKCSEDLINEGKKTKKGA